MSAKTLAYGEPPEKTTLVDQPRTNNKKARVTGPFTVEAVPAPVVKPITDIEDRPADVEAAPPLPADKSVARSGETLRQSDWRDELLKSGIRGKAGQRIMFASLEPLPGTRSLHATGETPLPPPPPPPPPEFQTSLPTGAGMVHESGPSSSPQRVAVSFGPDHAPLGTREVGLAIEEAQTLVPRPEILVFAGFQFDPEAAKDIDETAWPGVTLVKAQMNADLLTGDLKKKRANTDSFWLIGQPDVKVEKVEDGPDAGRYRVSVRGFDYFNTAKSTIESGDSRNIAVWMLDPDYDGRSLFPRQVFFPRLRQKARLDAVGQEFASRDRPRANQRLPRYDLAALRSGRLPPHWRSRSWTTGALKA